ncbi:hypothetical protein A2524_02775 [Candidatus Wolfebacteria bacterium RIFOXYD12_FULL_48_21]|nr:MAG: hypothetical protein A2524_02775 [Candidatus Wolfebacteria bacterium RIFOXYD12_FULL_48_21]
MLKPDCLIRQLEAEAFRRITLSGLQILLQKRLRLTQEDIDVLYSNLRGREFYEDMSYFLKSSDSLVFVVKGEVEDVVKLLNRTTGFTDPKNARTGTLRELGLDVRRNVAHSSADIEEVVKSVRHFFSSEELDNCITKCAL